MRQARDAGGWVPTIRPFSARVQDRFEHLEPAKKEELPTQVSEEGSTAHSREIHPHEKDISPDLASGALPAKGDTLSDGIGIIPDLAIEALPADGDTLSDGIGSLANGKILSPSHTELVSPMALERHVPGPSLAQLRSQVNLEFLHSDASQPSDWKIWGENRCLALELKSLQEQLDDAEADEAWRNEVGHWHEEVAQLRAALSAAQKREAEAKAARAKELEALNAARRLSEQLEAETIACKRAERQLAESAKQEASLKASADEIERRNRTIQRSMEQNAVLGRGGGTAHLFVAALPALDAAELEFAQKALQEHLEHLQAKDEES